MTKPLDFIVLGVPRSGTTATMRLLNVHPSIICGFERFRPSYDHTKITFPASFFDKSLPAAPAATRRINQLIEKKGERVSCVGNKTPLYFLSLASLLKGVPSRKVVFCYRDSQAIARSYSAREGRRRLPGGWVRGRVGIFGIIEYWVCLAQLATQDDMNALVVPYDALRSDPVTTALGIIAFLDSKLPQRLPAAGLERTAKVSHRALSREKPPLDALELAALELGDVAAAHALLTRDTPYRFEEVAASLAPFLRALGHDLVDNGIEIARRYQREEVERYAETWAGRTRRAWRQSYEKLAGALAPTS